MRPRGSQAEPTVETTAGTCPSQRILLENWSQVSELLALSPVPGSASPAAVDVIDLIVLVERHGLHTVREGSIQQPDT